MKHTAAIVLVPLCLAFFGPPPAMAGGSNYRNFDVALYSRVYETQQIGDPAWLESRWEVVSKNMKVDKIYLETSRDMVVVDQATLDKARKFFVSKGLKVSGGITATVSEANQFETYCYSNPEHRRGRTGCWRWSEASLKTDFCPPLGHARGSGIHLGREREQAVA
jgi:hypothetical protein